MASPRTSIQTTPDRQEQGKQLAALLEKAMEQPGVKDVMQVYGQWCETSEVSAAFQVYQRPFLQNILSSSSEPA
jgi:hypothetical protein